MGNKIITLALLFAVASQYGCSRMTLHEDYGKAVSKNKIMQIENLSAATDSHPAVKMDGQKADTVVENYRMEKPDVESADLTK